MIETIIITLEMVKIDDKSAMRRKCDQPGVVGEKDNCKSGQKEKGLRSFKVREISRCEDFLKLPKKQTTSELSEHGEVAWSCFGFLSINIEPNRFPASCFLQISDHARYSWRCVLTLRHSIELNAFNRKIYFRNLRKTSLDKCKNSVNLSSPVRCCIILRTKRLYLHIQSDLCRAVASDEESQGRKTTTPKEQSHEDIAR